MIVRVGLLDKNEVYISRLANYHSAHPNEMVQFEISLFTEEQALQKQMARGGRLDVLIAEEELLTEPESYARNLELGFWSEDKHEQMRDGYPVVCRYQKASEIFRAIQGMAAKRNRGTSTFGTQTDGKVFLFLNGAGGAGSSTTAVGCAANLAAQGRNTVYFSLKQNANDEALGVSGRSMTDVMYEIGMWQQLGGTDYGQLQMKLQSMLKQDDETGVHSFSAFDLPVSAMNFKAENVESLLQAIKGTCECCVIDADSFLSPLLLELIRLSDWTVVVSDSTVEGNQKTRKLLDSMEAIDSMDEKLIEGSVGLLYNKFGSTAQKMTELPAYVQELGTVPRYQNAEKSRIIRELSRSSVYTRLENRQ